MRNFFAVEMAEKADNEYPEYRKRHIIREVDPDIAKRQEDVGKIAQDFQAKWALPNWLSTLKTLLGAFGFICFALLITAKGENSANKLVFAILGTVASASFIVIMIYARQRRLKVEKSQEFKDFVSYTESLSSSINNSLKIPEDAIRVDIFCFPYQIKNGKIKGHTLFRYLNQPIDLFCEEGMLCLADAGAVFGINISDFTSITVNPRRVSFAGWSKQEMYNRGIYKEYKITAASTGILYVKNSCALHFTSDGEEYEITIPPYELPHFEKILGLKAQVSANSNDEDEEEEETEEASTPEAVNAQAEAEDATTPTETTTEDAPTPAEADILDNK